MSSPKWSRISGSSTPKAVRSSSSTMLSPNSTPEREERRALGGALLPPGPRAARGPSRPRRRRRWPRRLRRRCARWRRRPRPLRRRRWRRSGRRRRRGPRPHRRRPARAPSRPGGSRPHLLDRVVTGARPGIGRSAAGSRWGPSPRRRAARRRRPRPAAVPPSAVPASSASACSAISAASASTVSSGGCVGHLLDPHVGQQAGHDQPAARGDLAQRAVAQVGQHAAEPAGEHQQHEQQARRRWRGTATRPGRKKSTLWT